MLASRMSRRFVRTVDLLLLLWLVAFLVLGVVVGRQVDRLGALGEGLISAGDGVNRVADTLESGADVPLVGEGIGAVAEEIRGIGDRTAEQGRAGRAAAFRLAVGIGALIALAPTLPLLLVWVPLRIGWGRERRGIRRALAAGDDAYLAYLAHRAVTLRPFAELRRVSEHPIEDLNGGRFVDLAGIELARFGLASARSRRRRRTSA